MRVLRALVIAGLGTGSLVGLWFLVLQLKLVLDCLIYKMLVVGMEDFYRARPDLISFSCTPFLYWVLRDEVLTPVGLGILFVLIFFASLLKDKKGVKSNALALK